MYDSTPTTALPASLAAAALLCTGVALGASRTLDTCRDVQWTGEPAPEAASYQPPAAPARPAIRLSFRGGTGASWTRPIAPGLAGDSTLALRVWTPAPLALRVSARCGQGEYWAELRATPGEQILLVPLRVFNRNEGAGEWSECTRIGLSVPEPSFDAAMLLLDVQTISEQAVPEVDEILLHRPVSRLSPVGAAWPIYAILSETEYPQRSEKAPDILRSYLERMFGVSLPVNPEGVKADATTANVILAGRETALAAGAATESELDAQGYFGFVLRADDGRVAVAGQTRHGTVYGAYRFLEQQGCRFFWFGHHEVPERSDRAVRVREVKDRPFFDGKRIGGWSFNYGMPSDAMGDPRQAAALHGESEWFDKTLWIDHTAPYLVPKAVYYDEHPDYYAMRGDGTFLPKETSDVRTVICTTHPDVLRISADRALRWIEAQKDRKFFVVMQADDHEWCRCPRCRNMVYEPGNYSDAMLHWVNHVARAVAAQYPDKILICHAYGPTQPAPVKLKPEPNVHVLYAAWPNAGSAPCGIRDFDAPENDVARQQIMDWLAVAPDNIGLYDYNSGSRYTVYGMAWKVKWCARHGLRGFWYCGGNKSFGQLFNYVHGHLNWNPYQEVHTLKHDYIQACFGKAADKVETAFDAIYDRLEYGDYDGRMHGHPPADYYTMDFTRRVLALFDQALVLEPENEEIRETRRMFRGNCLSATRPAGRDSSEEQLAVFGMCLQEYLRDWLAEHAERVKEAKAEGKPAPGYDGLANTIWTWTRVKVEPDTPEGQAPRRIRDLIDDPIATIRAHMVTDFAERILRGWRLPAIAFTGARFYPGYNWKCEKKDGHVIYGTMTDLSRMQAELVLDTAPPQREGVIEIEGQDSDKIWCPAVPIQVVVNGRKLFEGPNPFVKRGWSRTTIPLPAGLVKEGENTIEIRSMANSDSMMSHWCMISEVLMTWPE